MALKIILKLNRGRLIGNILTLDAHEKKNQNSKDKHRQTKIVHHSKIKFLNKKTEILYNILKQSYEKGFLVIVFLQCIVTYYESEL